jgi:eukaryotic-like serine/threonine-protein kinase
VTPLTLALDAAPPDAARPPTTGKAPTGLVEPRRTLLEQAYSEFIRQQEAGAAPDPREFCARYPSIQHSLAQLLSVDDLLNHDPDFLGREAPCPEAGELFLGFRLERELGRGAFSRVFLAQETALGNRTVVVKVSHWGTSEALTLGRLAHPHIVPVYSVSTDERTGRSAVCMPYMGESTLGDLLDRVLAGAALPVDATIILDAARRGQPSCRASNRDAWDPDENRLGQASYIDGVRHLAEQLLDALAFIHKEGVCHRDLKPSNVLLTRGGVPMLLDFNLSNDSRQRDERLGGTPVYMPPEQLRLMGVDGADASGLDGRGDLFSLGVILYELLTCRHPFNPSPGTSPGMSPGTSRRTSLGDAKQRLLDRHAAGARPVRAVNPGVDRRFGELIDRCLAFAPAERPASATTARLLLAPTWREHLWRTIQRRALARSTVFAMLLSVGIVIAVPTMRAPSPLVLGQEAYRQGQYATAIEHFSQQLSADSEDRRAWLGRGAAHLRLHNYALAVTDLERAANGSNADAQTWACVGYALQKAGNQHPAASEQYERALAAGYRTAAVYNNLGYAYSKLRLPTKAEKCLTEALQIDGKLQAALFNRGSVYLAQAVRLPRPPAGNPQAAAIAGDQREALLESARVDLVQALEYGPPSGELFRETARAFTYLTPYRPGLVQSAIRYVGHAVENSNDGAFLRDQTIVAVLGGERDFQVLRQQPHPPKEESPAERIVAIYPD